MFACALVSDPASRDMACVIERVLYVVPAHHTFDTMVCAMHLLHGHYKQTPRDFHISLRTMHLSMFTL